MTAEVGFALDGRAADIWTIGVAASAILIRPLKRNIKGQTPCWKLNDCVKDFLNGSTLVPFVLLIGSVMSSKVLAEALQTNKVSMALAGMIGLLFILRELFSND